jgi:hypothetical protein
MFDDIPSGAPGASAPPAGGMFADIQPAKPDFGSDAYISSMAAKHNVPPGLVHGLVHNQMGQAGVTSVPLAGALTTRMGPAMSATFGGGAPGATWGERYGRNLALEQEVQSDWDAAHPIGSTAAHLAGGLAGTGSIAANLGTRAASSLGSKLLGIVEGGAWKQAGAGALSGTALNTLDALARGEPIGPAATTGGLIGFGAPFLGRAVGTLGQGAARFARGGTPPSAPQNVTRVGSVDVPISGGQASGDVVQQMQEQGALRGALGQGPADVAKGFFQGEQAPAAELARARIGESLDPYHQAVATSPIEAGEIVGQDVGALARASKANYQDLYKQALALPGEIHAGAFEGIGQRIKGELSMSRNPVVIDDVTTPIASRMVQQIDNQISQLRVQNRASPFGAPDPQRIVGINLAGIDQTRKQLIAMARGAQAGSADARAVGRVIGEFDGQVEDAIADGLFTGDDRALDLLQDARAAYSQHQNLFKAQGAGDDVGRAMERIVGMRNRDPATPNEIANFLYGAGKVGSSGLSVRLADHMRDLLGANSEGWSAIRQGLWARLTQATEGTTEMGPQKIAGRVGEFLNGSGAPLAQAMFSPAERNMMNQYAALQRQLIPAAGAVNYSNTAGTLRMILGHTTRAIGAALGMGMGDFTGAIFGHFAGQGVTKATQALGERSQAGMIARSLYRKPAQNAADAAFIQRMGALGSAVARPLALPPSVPALQQQ